MCYFVRVSVDTQEHPSDFMEDGISYWVFDEVTNKELGIMQRSGNSFLVFLGDQAMNFDSQEEAVRFLKE